MNRQKCEPLPAADDKPSESPKPMVTVVTTERALPPDGEAITEQPAGHSATGSTDPTDQATQAFDSKRPNAAPADLQTIRAALENPDAELNQLSKLVMLRVLNLLSELQRAPGGTIAAFDNKIKGLVYLHKLLVEHQTLRRKQDRLDIKGKKFSYVWTHMCTCFTQALAIAGVGSEMTSRVFREFRDIVAMAQEGFERDLKKI